MVKILCIETALETCSVALSIDGSCIAVLEETGNNIHAARLHPLIHVLLSGQKLEFSEIDAVCVSGGPGSYTGLRIGISSAKGLCYALGKPLLAVNTLKSLAFLAKQKADENTLLCPMIDARRMEVYMAVFDHQFNETVPTTAVVLPDNRIEKLLKENKVLFFGNGLSKAKPWLENFPGSVFLDPIKPSATGLCELAQNLFETGKVENLATFEPFYLKEFMAGNPSVKLQEMLKR